MISVIIPVYCCGKKIYACLDSLKKQTYKNFEVIIVNDCSPDDSKSIIVDYISNNPELNIKLITHDVNKRCGGARNTGVKNATGEYIFYLDQDDSLAPETFEKLLADNKDYDCISCDVKEANGIVESRTTFTELSIITDTDREKLIIEHGYVFGMLIKRSLLIEKDLCFPENVMFEDVFYNVNLFLEVRSFLYVAYCGVIRYGDENSQTAFLNQKKIDDRIKSAKWGYERAVKRANFEGVKKAVYLEYFYYMYMSNTLFMMVDKNLKISLKTIMYGIKETKSNSKFYWKEIANLDNRFNNRVRFTLKYVYKLPILSLCVKFLYLIIRGIKKCLKKI